MSEPTYCQKLYNIKEHEGMENVVRQTIHASRFVMMIERQKKLDGTYLRIYIEWYQSRRSKGNVEIAKTGDQHY